MINNLLPADTFIIFNKTILTDFDRKLLTLLYQPIIGSNAVSLYFTLWGYLDKLDDKSLEWTHHHLMTNMHLKVSDIKMAREKLEAVGLLKAYVKKGSINEYIYELYSPNTANEFMNNPLLNTTLYNNIGEAEYKNLVDYFKVSKVSTKDFEEITKTFQQVYSSICSYSEVPEVTIKKKVTNKIKIEESINVDTVLDFIPEEMLNHSLITRETKELIAKLSYIYNYDEKQMIHLIRNSIDSKMMIDKVNLKDAARRFYQFQNSGKKPILMYNEQPESLRKNIIDVTNKNKMIKQFENISPYEYLCSKYKDTAPTTMDLDVVNYLMVELKFKPGVVNVLIDYVLKINNNNLTKAFVESIASQWGKEKIETVEAAMKLAEKEYKLRKRIQNRTTKKEAIVPDWFNKDIKVKPVSKEKKIKMEEMLKEFR